MDCSRRSSVVHVKIDTLAMAMRKSSCVTRFVVVVVGQVDCACRCCAAGILGVVVLVADDNGCEAAAVSDMDHGNGALFVVGLAPAIVGFVVVAVWLLFVVFGSETRAVSFMEH